MKGTNGGIKINMDFRDQMSGRSGRGGNQNRLLILAAVVCLLIVVLVVGILLVKKMPSKERKSLEEYFGAVEGQVQIVLQDHLSEMKGVQQDNQIYVPFELVHDELNARFYWDKNENRLLYTTSSAVISTEVGSKNYSINKSKSSMDYNIVFVQGEIVYVALDFVKQYTALEYKRFEKPDRVVLTYRYGESYQCVKSSDATALRVEGSIKSPILEDLEKDSTLILLSSEETEEGFYQVQSEDGVVGYVKSKDIGKSYEYQPETDFKEEVYPHNLLDEKVCLVWHQVTNQTANAGLADLLADTKGVNVVAPTWFATSDNKGNISSLADDTYVQRAHASGVQVWGLCDDFSPNMKIGKVLGTTTRRQKLAKNLIAEAIRYSLDGINIDFENVKLASADDFIQFIRELGIMCRNNGLVLSIDNYPPADYSAYYNRTEQAAVADYVITMAYDEYHGGSKSAGPVSSITYVRDATVNTIAQVPAEQSVIALPFYSRLWKETTKGGNAKVTSEAMSMSYAEEVVSDSKAKLTWDETTQMNYAEYKKDNALYKIWLEDKTSLEAKLKVVSEGNTGGVAFWKLGLEKAGVWDCVTKYVK